MKKMIAAAILGILWVNTSWAAKTTYIVTNNRFNYVKLKEIKAKEAETLKITHPATLDEQGLRGALSSINLARSYVVKKEADTQQVFDENAINYLAPAIVRAFAQASPQEIVVFSYLSKNPYVFIRNDRLSICRAWISDGELHVKFEKLYAKLFGDTDKRGNEAKLISQARGLRVKLELGEGQKLGIDDTDEIVLSLNTNYTKKPEVAKVVTEGVTMSGEKVPLGGEEQTEEVPAKENKKAAKKGKVAKEAEFATTSQPLTTKSPKERLEELNDLKKNGLIDKKEYEEKKKEILKDL